MTAAYHYAMATGDAGAERLDLLDRAYGEGTRRALDKAGLRPGLAVVDFGCGTGTVTRWLASRVGPRGRVLGVDFSAEQLRKAAATARAAGLTNIEWVQASVEATGLPRATYDLACCRVTLKHLPAPAEAIREMHDVLRPGGVIVCEEAVLDSSECAPDARAHRRLQEMAAAMFTAMGCDWQVANRLYHLVRAAGFLAPEISYHQPVYARGPEKRFELDSFREVGERIAAKGVASAGEVADVADAVARLVDDEGVVYSLSRMTQVWARKPS